MPVIPRFEALDPSQCRKIHQASLEILRRTGVRVYHEEALSLLKGAGALISDDNLVRLPAAVVEQALKQAPSGLGLCRRGSDRVAVPLRLKQVSFGPGSDCPNYLDPDSQTRRPFKIRDVMACIRLVEALPELGFLMSMGIPADAPGNPYLVQFALMLANSSKPIVFVCNDRADAEAIVAMAAAVAGSPEILRLNPNLLLYSEPTSPLQHSATATGKLLYMAEQGLPVVHSPAPMMGGTAPVTLAGGLALGNAEVLSSLVIHQLKRGGAPFVYGSGLHHMDMKTAISVYGAPEFQLARLGVAAMGQFYNLPTWGYAGHSDSQVFDAQAATDAVFSVLVALLTGTNLVHDVGYLEAGLTTSPQMMVFTCEIIAMMRRFAAGVSLDAEALALEVIHRVGPGGDYLSDPHTLAHFRTLWQPSLFDRQRFEAWQQGGSRELGDRLRQQTLALMEQQPAPLPGKVGDEIGYILRERGVSPEILTDG